MKRLRLPVLLLLAWGMILGGCAATVEFTPVSDPSVPFELGTLSFPAPTGEGWEFTRDSTPPIEYVQFLKRNEEKSGGFVASVVTVDLGAPLASAEELRKEFLHPLREVVQGQQRFEVLSVKCDQDTRFSRVGVACSLEGRDYGFFGMTPEKPVAVRGHGYAFALPNDPTQVVVIEFVEGDPRGKPAANTRALLGEFVRKVSLGK